MSNPIAIRASFDYSKFEQLRRSMPRKVERAAARSLNYAGRRTKTDGKRLVAAAVGVPVGIAARRIHTGKASGARLSIPIYTQAKPFSGYSLKPKPSGGGVRLSSVRKGQRKFDRAFVLQPGHVSAHSGRRFPKGIVLQREEGPGEARSWGDPQLPVQAVEVPHFIKSASVLERVAQRIGVPAFQREFNRLMRVSLNKRGSR